MRSIFSITMILFLLTACRTAAQPLAPTAPVTIPPTSTLAPTAAPTTIPPTETATPTEAPVPRYEISTLDKFKGVEEPIYVIPEDDPSGTEYLAWLHSQETPFDPGAQPMQLGDREKQISVGYDLGNPDVVKILSDPKKRPYHYGPIGHWVSKSGVESLLFSYDILGENKSHNWVVTAFRIKAPSGKNKFELTPGKIRYYVDNWKRYGPVFNFSEDYTYLDATNFDGFDWLKDDLVYRSQLRYPDRLNLSGKFIDNIDSSLEKPGLIYGTIIITSQTSQNN